MPQKKEKKKRTWIKTYLLYRNVFNSVISFTKGPPFTNFIILGAGILRLFAYWPRFRRKTMWAFECMWTSPCSSVRFSLSTSAWVQLEILAGSCQRLLRAGLAGDGLEKNPPAVTRLQLSSPTGQMQIESTPSCESKHTFSPSHSHFYFPPKNSCELKSRVFIWFFFLFFFVLEFE